MHSSQQVWLAVIAVVLALMIATWIYGIYCYVQMVRHRRPGISATSLLWPPDYLSQRGREFRRRALWSYAVFAGLALFLVALNYLVLR
jgi:hypothetical protein